MADLIIPLAQVPGPRLRNRGPWTPGAYAPPSMVTDQGRLWTCEQPTSARPGSTEAEGKWVEAGDFTPASDARAETEALAGQVANDAEAVEISRIAVAQDRAAVFTDRGTAEAAADAAAAARGLAQTARTGSEAARDSSEAARDEAQAIVATQSIIVDTKAQLDANAVALTGQVLIGVAGNGFADVGFYGRSTPGNPATAWVKKSDGTIPALAIKTKATDLRTAGIENPAPMLRSAFYYDNAVQAAADDASWQGANPDGTTDIILSARARDLSGVTDLERRTAGVKNPTPLRRSAFFYDSAVQGADDDLVWQGANPDGTTDVILSPVARGLSGITALERIARQIDQPQPMLRSAYYYLFAVANADGEVALGVNHDYSIDLDTGAEPVSNYQSPAVYSEIYDVFNVRTTATHLIATTQDRDGLVFDVKKRIGSAGAAGLVDSAAPVEIVGYQGQSNSGEGGLTGVVLSKALFPHHCTSFATVSDHQGPSLISASALSDIGPLFDPAGADLSVGQFPATTTAFAIERLDRDDKRRSGGYFAWTAWQSGVALSNFVVGSANWTNLITGLVKGKAELATLDRDVVMHALHLVHGESGPSDRTTYKDELLAHIASARPALVTALALPSAPQILFAQINTPDGGSLTYGPRLAQLDVERQLAGVGAQLSVPLYAYPHPPIALGDQSHLGPIGRLMQGEAEAYVHRRARATRVSGAPAYRCLQAASHARAGAVITTTYLVPGAPIALDADWVKPITTHGFRAYAAGSPVSIASVAIASGKTVVTLSADPGAGVAVELSYAEGGVDTTYDGWSGGRGTLYSDTGVPSVYVREGFTVPPTIRIYCAAFRDAVTEA